MRRLYGHQFQLVVTTHEDVCPFDISMHDTMGVQVLEAEQNFSRVLGHDALSAALGHTTPPAGSDKVT